MRAVAMMAVIAGLMAGGCVGSRDGESPDDTDRLYAETVALADRYADSIRRAPDSLAALEAMAGFEQAYDSLNLSVAPNTDFLLNEGENDT